MWLDGPWYGFHWWMGIFPLLFMVVFVVFLFGAGRWMFSGRHMHEGHGNSAREILDRRYARGEIGKEEYQRMRKDLE